MGWQSGKRPVAGSTFWIQRTKYNIAIRCSNYQFIYLKNGSIMYANFNTSSTIFLVAGKKNATGKKKKSYLFHDIGFWESPVRGAK